MIRLLRSFAGALCLLGVCLGLPSPAAGATPDLKTWLQLTLQGDLNSRWTLFGEIQPRVGDELSHFDSLILRGAIGHKLFPKVSVWLGYAWTPHFLPDADDVPSVPGAQGFRDEQRPYQQVTWEEDLGEHFSLQNRSRLEERIIHGTGGVSLRFRHQARALVSPFRRSRFAFAFSNEVFLTLNELGQGPPSGFDQNRTFVGVNVRLSYETAIEVGYLNNLVRQRPPAEALVNHVIALNVWTTLF